MAIFGIQGLQSELQEFNSARTLSQSTHDTTTHRTPSHRITRADKSRGLAAASGTGAQVKASCCLSSLCVELKQGSYSHLACRLLFHQGFLLSSPPHGCFAKSSSIPWPYQPGRSAGRALFNRIFCGLSYPKRADSCEGSRPTSQSGIVRVKAAVMIDGKDVPAGEGLPDGWLKELRPRKNRHGSRIKGDMFYIDPIHGYEFWSLKDVYRYLQSGDISQCAKLPNKRKIEDLHSAGGASHHTVRPSNCTHLDTTSESNKYEVGGTESPGDAGLSPQRGSSKPDNINPIQREYGKIEASEIRSTQSGSEEYALGEAKSVPRKGVSVVQRTKEKKHKAKPVKQLATPLRSSPRLAALKTSQEANNASRDGPASMQTDITNQSQPKQVKNPRRMANSSVLPEKNDGTSSLSEKTEDNYCLVPNQTRALVPCSSADVGCQNALAGVPILPQQVELDGTTAGMPGAALSSLFRHVWSDPCLQFAFRTLIGDIPVFNDSLAAANYFLPQQNLNKEATPNCSSSAYDGPRNHAQVDHVSLSMPRPSDKLFGSSWFAPQ